MRTIDKRRYTDVAIALHWATAVAVLYNLASGLLGEYLPKGFFAFHVSSGITILALTVLRVLWRLTYRPPPMLPMPGWERRLAKTTYLLWYLALLMVPLSGWAMVSANPPPGSPGAAYAEAHRTPAPPPPTPTGAPSTAAPGGPAGEGKGGGQPPRKHGPIMIWGLFRLPLIAPISEIGRTPAGVPEQHAVHERIERVHLIGGWVVLSLLVLHVGGALKLQLVDRRRELARMGLGRPEPA